MPYTAKQNRFFRAVAHGWKPSDPKLKHLSKGKAAELAEEGVKGGLKEHLTGMLKKGKLKASKKKRRIPGRREAGMRVSAGPAGGGY